jgi:5-formyltetrahydrofolate cyclo-ligase
MIKESLRILFKQKREALSAPLKLQLDDLLLNQFQQLAIDIPANIMSYKIKNNSNEFDPQLVMDYCYLKKVGIKLSFPRMLPDFNSAAMVSEELGSSTQFLINAYGIPEPKGGSEISPELIDLVIVPLLCFDESGHRVGYGKGYYDRFLKNCRKDCIKIGFSYFSPIASIDDTNAFDIPLDYGISPDAIHEFH